MREWYIAKTKPHREIQASVILGKHGLETYFPFMVGRPKNPPLKLEPLFPGYLFVRLDPSTVDWVHSRSAPGVAYFLGSGGLPTPVPEALVEEIRYRLAGNDYTKRRYSFSPGDSVRIEGGPFDGLDAIFDCELSAMGRCRVLVSIVNRLVPMSVDIGQLRRT